MSDETNTTAPAITPDLKVCPKDGEPVIFTFEFPGAEYACVVCRGTYGIFGTAHAYATDELVARHAELADRYEVERVARGGPPRPPEPDRPAPACVGCGQVAPTSRKPPHWYVRTRDGVDQYACSRGCIDRNGGGTVLPW